jgi:hypothetical protein
MVRPRAQRQPTRNELGLGYARVLEEGYGLGTIFISYRRDDDTAATLLAQHLEHQGFDLFFDRDAIRAGEDFPARIAQGLASCRVLLAVVGREWASPRNLARLAEATDFVRRELEAGLARGGDVVVLPVLVDGASLPDAQRLPSSLQPLLQKDFAEVTTRNFRTDAPALVQRLNDLLQAGRPRTKPVLPHLLPTLCDRVEQQDALALRLGADATPAPHVCVLHGFSREGHAQFLERALAAHDCLPALLRSQETGIARHLLDLNREALRQGRHQDALRLALKRKVLGAPTASDDELQRFLRTSRQPLVVAAHLSATDEPPSGGLLGKLKALAGARSKQPSPLVAGLAHAWRALFPEAPRSHMLLWVNVAWEKPAEGDAFESVDGALPPLRALSASDVLAWLAQPEVQPFFVGREAAVHRIAEGEDARRGRLHMVDFSDEVLRLVEAGAS